jgi:pimeloyl-ACP methyl ester carboxylesterase
VAKDSGPDLMKRAYMEGIKTDPRATLVDLEASRQWSDGFNLPDDGRSVVCPTRIVSGSAESENCLARADELSRSLPRASTALVDGAAHFLPLEKPEALVKEIQLLAEAV